MLGRPCFSPEAVYRIEDRVCAEQALSQLDLMQRAGLALWRALQHHYPQARHIGIAIGPGYNGGDGWILAGLAQKAGLKVSIWSLMPEVQGNAIIKAARQAAHDCGISIDEDFAAIKAVDLWVDALFGMGGRAQLPERVSQWSTMVQQSGVPVLAVDVPSGVDALSGQADPCAVVADVCLSFVARKVGLYTGAACNHVGLSLFDDLGVQHAASDPMPLAYLWHWQAIQNHLPKRLKDSNKGSFGHVCIVVGEQLGAAFLVAQAAMAVGAGKITLALPNDDLKWQVLQHFPSYLVCSYAQLPALQADVFVIGPGLGLDAMAQSVFKQLHALNQPTLLDADALTLWAQKPDLSFDTAIITPHPKEAMRLLGWPTIKAIQQNRLVTLEALNARYAATCILKGAGTWVGDQRCHGVLMRPAVCHYASSAMAKAGMGDVLAGVVAGLWCQGLAQDQAALYGALLHAEAAMVLARCLGERSVTTEAVVSALSEVLCPIP